eukprot:6535-Pyramimonas_sp.AAC.1
MWQKVRSQVLGGIWYPILERAILDIPLDLDIDLEHLCPSHRVILKMMRDSGCVLKYESSRLSVDGVMAAWSRKHRFSLERVTHAVHQCWSPVALEIGRSWGGAHLCRITNKTRRAD